MQDNNINANESLRFGSDYLLAAINSHAERQAVLAAHKDACQATQQPAIISALGLLALAVEAIEPTGSVSSLDRVNKKVAPTTDDLKALGKALDNGGEHPLVASVYQTSPHGLVSQAELNQLEVYKDQLELLDGPVDFEEPTLQRVRAVEVPAEGDLKVRNRLVVATLVHRLVHPEEEQAVPAPKSFIVDQQAREGERLRFKREAVLERLAQNLEVQKRMAQHIQEHNATAVADAVAAAVAATREGGDLGTVRQRLIAQDVTVGTILAPNRALSYSTATIEAELERLSNTTNTHFVPSNFSKLGLIARLSGNTSVVAQVVVDLSTYAI